MGLAETWAAAQACRAHSPLQLRVARGALRSASAASKERERRGTRIHTEREKISSSKRWQLREQGLILLLLLLLRKVAERPLGVSSRGDDQGRGGGGACKGESDLSLSLSLSLSIAPRQTAPAGEFAGSAMAWNNKKAGLSRAQSCAAAAAAGALGKALLLLLQKTKLHSTPPDSCRLPLCKRSSGGTWIASECFFFSPPLSLPSESANKSLSLAEQARYPPLDIDYPPPPYGKVAARLLFPATSPAAAAAAPPPPPFTLDQSVAHTRFRLWNLALSSKPRPPPPLSLPQRRKGNAPTSSSSADYMLLPAFYPQGSSPWPPSPLSRSALPRAQTRFRVRVIALGSRSAVPIAICCSPTHAFPFQGRPAYPDESEAGTL